MATPASHGQQNDPLLIQGDTTAAAGESTESGADRDGAVDLVDIMEPMVRNSQNWKWGRENGRWGKREREVREERTGGYCIQMGIIASHWLEAGAT